MSAIMCKDASARKTAEHVQCVSPYFLVNFKLRSAGQTSNENRISVLARLMGASLMTSGEIKDFVISSYMHYGTPYELTVRSSLFLKK